MKTGNEKNNSNDIDEEFYSLHYFLKLACEGQTVALDMLHAPDEMIIEKSLIWDSIIRHKEKFYTKNLKSFIGYARRQAAKYGIKGSRLNAVHKVILFLKTINPEQKLRAVWDKMPLGEHLYFIDPNPQGIRQYQICGKIFQETTRINHILPILERFLAEYGKRARQAAENKGIRLEGRVPCHSSSISSKTIINRKYHYFSAKKRRFSHKSKNWTTQLHK